MKGDQRNSKQMKVLAFILQGHLHSQHCMWLLEHHQEWSQSAEQGVLVWPLQKNKNISGLEVAPRVEHRPVWSKNTKDGPERWHSGEGICLEHGQPELDLGISYGPPSPARVISECRTKSKPWTILGVPPEQKSKTKLIKKKKTRNLECMACMIWLWDWCPVLYHPQALLAWAAQYCQVRVPDPHP